MKVLITFSLVLFSLQLYAQDSSIAQYERRSDTLVAKLRSKQISEDEKKELNKIAIVIQNHGQFLGDSRDEYESSLKYIDKAIDLFIDLEDTLSQANNLKFKGYLLAMLGKYPAAKTETQKAIKLYTLKNSITGIAVSEFDLCRVYDQENIIDSAIYHCTLSLNIWKVQNNIFRIFNVQTMFIHLLAKSKQYDEAISIQKECEKVIANKEIHQRNLVDFYFVLVKLYKLKNQKDMEKLYQQKLSKAQSEAGEFKSYYKAL